MLRRELDDLGVLDPGEPMDEARVDLEGVPRLHHQIFRPPVGVAQLHPHAPRLEVEGIRLPIVVVEGAALALLQSQDLVAVERVVVDEELLSLHFRNTMMSRIKTSVASALEGGLR